MWWFASSAFAARCETSRAQRFSSSLRSSRASQKAQAIWLPKVLMMSSGQWGPGLDVGRAALGLLVLGHVRHARLLGGGAVEVVHHGDQTPAGVEQLRVFLALQEGHHRSQVALGALLERAVDAVVQLVEAQPAAHGSLALRIPLANGRDLLLVALQVAHGLQLLRVLVAELEVVRVLLHPFAQPAEGALVALDALDLGHEGLGRQVPADEVAHLAVRLEEQERRIAGHAVLQGDRRAVAALRIDVVAEHVAHLGHHRVGGEGLFVQPLAPAAPVGPEVEEDDLVLLLGLGHQLLEGALEPGQLAVGRRRWSARAVPPGRTARRSPGW